MLIRNYHYNYPTNYKYTCNYVCAKILYIISQIRMIWPQCTPKPLSSEPNTATRKQQATEKTPVK